MKLYENMSCMIIIRGDKWLKHEIYILDEALEAELLVRDRCGNLVCDSLGEGLGSLDAIVNLLKTAKFVRPGIHFNTAVYKSD